MGDITTLKHHIIVHKEIYAKEKSDTGYYPGMSMEELYVTVTFLSKKNGSTVHDRIVVHGHELETMMHNSLSIGSKNNKTCIYDDTKVSGTVSNDFYFRQQRFSQQSQTMFSQESTSTHLNYGNKDPPEDIVYFNM